VYLSSIVFSLSSSAGITQTPLPSPEDILYLRYETQSLTSLAIPSRMTESQEVWDLGNKKYIYTSNTFIKSEYYPGEPQSNGNPSYALKWSSQRLQHEAAVLQFIKQHPYLRTVIPVPAVISCDRDKQGRMQLILERIHGITAEEVGQQCRQPQGRVHVAKSPCDQCQQIANDNVDSVMDSIVAAMQSVKFNETGLNGFMLPPPRIYEYDERDVWVPKRASIGDQYVFCHGELSRNTIMVHPVTLKVVAIIDWENAGFYQAMPSVSDGPLPAMEAAHRTDLGS
jgi:hypothetical protein